MCLTDCREALKLAVTEAAELRFRLQLPVPEQAPLQPVNTEPSLLLGVADKLTLVPLVKLELHELLQSIPAGLLCTVPLPEPEIETVRSELPGCELLGGGGPVWALSLDLPPAQPASVKASAASTTVKKRGNFNI